MIDPVAFAVGPLRIHWYGLAYMSGIFIAWIYLKNLAKKYDPQLNIKIFDDFVSWIVIGIIVGGRLGHVLLYNFNHYLAFPQEILMVWKGGMSFHGGLLGVIVATTLFCRKKNISLFLFSDYLAIGAPIGIFFGRIANFINGELYGRITTTPWGVIFPHGGPLPRHPSQIYEAIFEGIILFIIINLSFRSSWKKESGKTAGLFLVTYALMRCLMEIFREIEWGISLGMFILTAGQILSIPMIIFGTWLLLQKNESTS